MIFLYIHGFASSSHSNKVTLLKKQLSKFKTKQVDNSKILLLLQKGDEVINYKEAISFLPDAKTIIETGGSHQFDAFDNYFKIIKNFVQ